MRLIDADELFEHISHLSVTVTGLRSGKGILSEYAKHYRESVLRTVDEAPTVDAVPVVYGQWVRHYYDSGEQIGDEWYCSECNMCNDRRRTWYCPHCGAKMKGGHEE